MMFAFKKKDEMERDISNKGIVISYYFTTALLVIWIIRNLIINQSAVLPLYVLVMQFIVEKISVLIYKRSVGDSRWKKGLVILLTVIVIIFLALTISPRIQ